MFLRQRIDGAVSPGQPARIQHLVCTPAEVLHYDILVPVGWSDPGRTSVRAFARPHDVMLARECRSVDRLPVYDDADFIPGVQTVPHTPDSPRWPDLVSHILAERGWLGKAFDLHRLRVAYPMMHASVEFEAAPRTA
jgi:hypothetical protein